MNNIYDFVIIGSGPSGYESALKLKHAGYSVCIIEKNELGGVCLNSGCIPTKVMVSAGNKFSELNNLKRYGIKLEGDKSFDFATFKNFQKSVITRLKKGLENSLKNAEIELIKGRAEIKNNTTLNVFFESQNFEIGFKNLIIATGSRPFVPESWSGVKNLVSSENFWQLENIPENIAIIGGGVIGCEYASSLADLGYNIFLIEKVDRLLVTEEKEISDAIYNDLKAKGVKIFLGASIQNVENFDGKIKITRSPSESIADEMIESDLAVCCMGRIRNLDNLGLENLANIELKNNDVLKIDDFKLTENIYLLGDVANGPQLAHKGYYDAEILTEKLISKSNKKIISNYENMPMAVFTNPEISRVGLTKEKACEKFGEDNIRQIRVNFAEIGKAVAENFTKGFLLMNVLVSTGEILGISIIGHNASEFCAVSTIIISQKLTIKDIKNITFSHPTVSEIFKVAVERIL